MARSVPKHLAIGEVLDHSRNVSTTAMSEGTPHGEAGVLRPGEISVRISQKFQPPQTPWRALVVVQTQTVQVGSGGQRALRSACSRA